VHALPQSQVSSEGEKMITSNKLTVRHKSAFTGFEGEIWNLGDSGLNPPRGITLKRLGEKGSLDFV
jgi:hypothetical protein